MNDHVKMASGTIGTFTAWFAWLVAHIAEVNEFVQFGVLCVGLATGIYTLRFAMTRK